MTDMCGTGLESKHKIVNIFLPISFNIYILGRDSGFEYTQHMFWLEIRKKIVTHLSGYETHMLIFNRQLICGLYLRMKKMEKNN